MTVVATFENGVFVPREKIDLPSGTQVTIDVENALSERASRLRAIEELGELGRRNGVQLSEGWTFDRKELYP